MQLADTGHRSVRLEWHRDTILNLNLNLINRKDISPIMIHCMSPQPATLSLSCQRCYWVSMTMINKRKWTEMLILQILLLLFQDWTDFWHLVTRVSIPCVLNPCTGTCCMCGFSSNAIGQTTQGEPRSSSHTYKCCHNRSTVTESLVKSH